MEMDRLDALALIVLAGLAAAMAYMAFFSTPQAPTGCAGLSNLSAQLDCQAEAARKSSLSACQGADLPDACAGLYAHRQGLDACGQWADPQACRYFAYSARLEEGDVTREEGLAACRSFTNATWRYACLERHVQYLLDPAFCQEMEIGYYRDRCLGQVKQLQ